LHARSGGHRVQPGPNRRDLKPRKETMSVIWRSRALKPKSATQSGRRITTSTLNIILGRYTRTEKERKTLCCDCRQIRRSNFPTSTASESCTGLQVRISSEPRYRLRLCQVATCFSEEDSGPHTPALRAFKLVDRMVAASWMLLDNSELYWLAASRAVSFIKRSKGMAGSFASSVMAVNVRQ
jgi:hypothetical protein